MENFNLCGFNSPRLAACSDKISPLLAAGKFIGLLRHRVPFETDLEGITQQLLDFVVYDINHAPR